MNNDNSFLVKICALQVAVSSGTGIGLRTSVEANNARDQSLEQRTSLRVIKISSQFCYKAGCERSVQCEGIVKALGKAFGILNICENSNQLVDQLIREEIFTKNRILNLELFGYLNVGSNYHQIKNYQKYYENFFIPMHFASFSKF